MTNRRPADNAPEPYEAMFALLLLPLAEVNMMWYSIPLIIVISLVYAATHHELLRPILEHATRLALMISGFMLAIMVVLAIISWQL